jgi:hypothetical protein
MQQDEPTEDAPEVPPGSGLTDVWTETRKPDSEYVLVVEVPEEDCGLDRSNEPDVADMGERLPGDDRTINKP